MKLLTRTINKPIYVNMLHVDYNIIYFGINSKVVDQN